MIGGGIGDQRPEQIVPAPHGRVQARGEGIAPLFSLPPALPLRVPLCVSGAAFLSCADACVLGVLGVLGVFGWAGFARADDAGRRAGARVGAGVVAGGGFFGAGTSFSATATAVFAG